MITFYGLKNCDTCKKALKALADHDVTVVDVRADGISAELLADWVSRVGADVLINKRSTTWRGLDEDARSAAESNEGAVRLMAENPTLMKRPVIVRGDDVSVGWTKDVQAAFA
ncbi:MAG: Spx/MgsR family RNA polymerase-binding regulatory protein [Pikeienuella sp.]